ncbi:MAG: DUF393 domain-containing protein [Longispora sp.]|nr:DUF393 domain-containing protein [Longispora sp. (in: high G+C Gram-positive bacteria)]
MTPIFLYDGDCAFCSTCARFVERRLRSGAEVIPWQRADLTALGVTVAQAEEAVQWIDDAGVASGPAGIAKLLRASRPVWRPLGIVLGWRPVLAVAWPIYRWISRNRHRLPGGTATCSLPQAQRDAL